MLPGLLSQLVGYDPRYNAFPQPAFLLSYLSQATIQQCSGIRDG